MSEKLKGGYFKDLTIDGKIILNLKVKEIGTDYGLDYFGLGYAAIARCCEKDAEFYISLKDGGFVDRLQN
jgi:hypothetical protein